ncbi:MAG: molybdopterin cofactor-binding domain-containing protein, partial [Bacillota bacterium]
HWKTVASLTGYMAGNAVMRAADDLIAQLRNNGALAFGCSEEEIEVTRGRVYRRDNPENFISFGDIVNGYTAPDGTSIGEPALGRGGFMLKGLTTLDPRTGKGKTGPAWTLGAQMVEIEVDVSEYTYRILSANTVIDIGKVINPDAMRSMVMGGMAMGVSMASREAYHYDENGALSTPNLRTYKLLHIGQEPLYRVDFVETPQEDSPYGVRSFSEHGIIGIPAALGNALSAALHHEVNRLPLTPEMLWTACTGGADDTD